jgi:hypothetical protein
VRGRGDNFHLDLLMNIILSRMRIMGKNPSYLTGRKRRLYPIFSRNFGVTQVCKQVWIKLTLNGIMRRLTVALNHYEKTGRYRITRKRLDINL